MSNPQFQQSPSPNTQLATTAMILGFAAFLLGPLAAVPAIICGSTALRRNTLNPQTHGGRTMAFSGVYFGILTSVLFLIAATFFLIGLYTHTGPMASIAPAIANALPASNDSRRKEDAEHVTAIVAILRKIKYDGFGVLDAFWTPDLSEKFISPGTFTTPLVPFRLPSTAYKDGNLKFDRIPNEYKSDSRTVILGLNEGYIFKMADFYQHCDYTLIGQDVSPFDPDIDKIIILYTKDNHLGGRTLGYADGSATFVEEKDLQAAFDESNKYRAKIGLPPLKPDGQSPPPRPSSIPFPLPPVPEQIVQNPPQNPTQMPINITPTPFPTPFPTRTPPPPPTPPLHTVFTNLTDARTYLQTGQPPKRRAALAFIAKLPVSDADRFTVTDALERLLSDPTLRSPAFAIYAKWANQDNLPALQTFLQDATQRDPEGKNNDDIPNRRAAIQLLARFNDAASTKTIARGLRNPQLHDDAAAALKTLGPSAESQLILLLPDNDAPLALDVIKYLAAAGTEQSILPLHRALASDQKDIPPAAADALNHIGPRLKLKPDDYLFNILNHFIIEAPAGFKADDSATPDTRSWSHTATGRAVKSSFVLHAKFVGDNYHINAPDNAPTLDAANLTFHQTAAGNAGPFQQGVAYAALDGPYLLELTAIIDTADSSAANALTAAAKKIHIRPDPPASQPAHP